MVGGLIVTDMLAAVLNICTQEELNESAEEPSSNVVTVDRDKAERRKVIKNKILAVGRISHMFSVLRCVIMCL
jgi:serine/threonine-protein phosphatase 2B catalytic subunit